MKPANVQVVHHVEEIDESMRMSLDADSIVHLMQVLTDLYSDPILAVIREYSTNALDSHIEAENDQPIEVTLPTQLSPHFTVRDFGVGLNVDDLRNVYSMYGKSTKRESDAVTGTLGLGCKSGLTYALSFTVTAVKNGLKTVAAITKDVDGVGTIKILDTSATDDPNGVTVQIPVKAHDIHGFVMKAKGFYKYWRPGTVLVDGEEPFFGDDTTIWLDEDVAVISGYNESRIVMGGVPYPFDCHLSGDASIVAWVPMGCVNFTPSREALHHTAKTADTLATLKEFVDQRLAWAITNQIENAPTPYQQLVIAQKWWTYARQLMRTHWARKGELQMPRHAWELNKTWRRTGTKVRATKEPNIRLASLIGNSPIITRYPNLTVPNGHRARLAELGYTEDTVLILPEGTDLYYLRGRENVHTWQWVLDNTETPSKETSGVSAKTTYLVYHNGTRYETPKITETDAPIIYSTPQSGSWMIRDYPEARAVDIQARQVDRFLRLHPKAIKVQDYHRKVVEDCKKRLTATDKMFAGFDQGRLATLEKVASRIDDPELAAVARLPKAQKSKAMERLISLRAHSDLPRDPIHTRVAMRYPLLAQAYVQPKDLDEWVLYFNSKFEHINREDQT